MPCKEGTPWWNNQSKVYFRQKDIYIDGQLYTSLCVTDFILKILNAETLLKSVL